MITLTAEVLCDSCGKVCGVGEPVALPKMHWDTSHWSTNAISYAEAKARSHGAQINVASVTCRSCLESVDGPTAAQCNDILGKPNHYT